MAINVSRMLERKLLLLTNMKCIQLLIVLSIGSMLSSINGEMATTQVVIVKVGDSITLDCHLGADRILIDYPVYLATRRTDKYIGIKDQNEPPYIYEDYSYLSYNVTYGMNQAGAWIFSLIISGVEAYHAGEYRCSDSHYCRNPQDPCQTFYISAVTNCRCPTPEGIENMAGDERVTVNCILEGYLGSNPDTVVNITLGNKKTVQGTVRGSTINTGVKAKRLCENISLEFYLNPNFPDNLIQCQLPILNPCPYDRFTTPILTTLKKTDLPINATTKGNVGIHFQTTISPIPFPTRYIGFWCCSCRCPDCGDYSNNFHYNFPSSTQ